MIEKGYTHGKAQKSCRRRDHQRGKIDFRLRKTVDQRIAVHQEGRQIFTAFRNQADDRANENDTAASEQNARIGIGNRGKQDHQRNDENTEYPPADR